MYFIIYIYIYIYTTIILPFLVLIFVSNSTTPIPSFPPPFAHNPPPFLTSCLGYYAEEAELRRLNSIAPSSSPSLGGLSKRGNSSSQHWPLPPNTIPRAGRPPSPHANFNNKKNNNNNNNNNILPTASSNEAEQGRDTNERVANTTSDDNSEDLVSFILIRFIWQHCMPSTV